MRILKPKSIRAAIITLFFLAGCGVESTEYNGGAGAGLPLEGTWKLMWYNEAPYPSEWQISFIAPDRVQFSGGSTGSYKIQQGTHPTVVLLRMSGPEMQAIMQCPTPDSLMMVTPENQSPGVPPAESFEAATGYIRWRLRRVS